MSDLREWINSLPIFTRYWLLSTIALSLIGRFNIVSPHVFYLLYDPFIHNFQIWRAITSLLFYPMSFHFLINCYFLYRYSLKLETTEYVGRPADYCFLLLFNWLCCLVIGLIGDVRLLMDCMVMSVLYIWCQLNQDVIVTFWFGTQFKAMYLPWVLAGFNLVIYGGGMMELIGILVGHLYFFLKFKYPQEYDGPELLNTPRILEHYFPPQRVTQGFSGSIPRPGAPAPARNMFGGYHWGQGQTLGG